MSLVNKIFSESLLNWYDHHGRKDLPWQHPQTAYHVWISEMMLQQTQVQTVIPYFLRFIEHFPNIQSLAKAHIDEVLTLWSGLGYYSRARNLHRSALCIANDYSGQFPSDLHTLQSLPGIGPSTAAAIASLAFDQPTAILDGNVKRVLSRYFLIGDPITRVREKRLWQQALACMPSVRCRDYTQAIMDMGATCCTQTRPNCQACPLQTNCLAYQRNVISDYPPKKAKIIRPTREEQFLVLFTENQHIYLEQRPSLGVWGGLWCFPTISIEACLKTFLSERYAIDMREEAQDLIRLKHSFTHFHLHINAKILKIQPNFNFTGRWISEKELDQIGLPKPVRVIADYFFKKGLTDCC